MDQGRSQAERISSCRLTLRIKMGKTTGLINQNIVDTAIFLDASEARQPSLFTEKAKLSEGFYDQLTRQHVSIFRGEAPCCIRPSRLSRPSAPRVLAFRRFRACLVTWLEWSAGGCLRAPERSGLFGREHRSTANARQMAVPGALRDRLLE